MLFRTFGVILWIASAVCVIVIGFAITMGAELPLIAELMQGDKFAELSIVILIVALFGWVLIDIALEARRVLREVRDLKVFRDKFAASEPAADVGGALAPGKTRAMRRAQLYLGHLGEGKPPEALHELLPGAAALDANALPARYSALHVYAWILPVLGFIGTALGMAASIGGFKGALSNPDSFDRIIAKLSQDVIPGLAGAFGTTILALAASLIAYLCTTAVKEWDQEALDHLDQACFEVLKTVPTAQGRMVLLLAGISDQLLRIGKLPLEVETTAHKLNDAAAELVAASKQLHVSTRELLEAAKKPTRITIERGEAV